MSEKILRNVVIGSALVGCVCAAVLGFKKFYNKNFLKCNKLIDKNTEILNVYTYDYFIKAAGYLDCLNEKEGSVSSVYTKRALKEADLIIFGDELVSKKDSKREYEQVVRFAKELNRITPGATMVIYAISEEEIGKYNNIKEELGLSIDVKFNNKIEAMMFEE